MNAFADGAELRDLYTHPAVKPALLKVSALVPLLWTDGSIGAISTGDITENDAGGLYFGTTASLVSPIKNAGRAI